MPWQHRFIIFISPGSPRWRPLPRPQPGRLGPLSHLPLPIAPNAVTIFKKDSDLSSCYNLLFNIFVVRVRIAVELRTSIRSIPPILFSPMRLWAPSPLSVSLTLRLYFLSSHLCIDYTSSVHLWMVNDPVCSCSIAAYPFLSGQQSFF
jgi:hypothetical protein